MTPSYQVLSGLARVFAADSRPWDRLLDDAAAIIGEGTGAACMIGVRIGSGAVFDPVGVHDNDRQGQAQGRGDESRRRAWPVSRRAELVLASGRPSLGPESTNIVRQADSESAASWREVVDESPRLVQVMVSIRSAGVGIGVVVLARKRTEPAFTEADAQDLKGPVDLLAVALRELTVRPQDDALAVTAARATHSNVGTLNGREREVIVLMAQGLTTAEIGETMYLSARTVEWYRASILRKLDRPTRAELVTLGRSFASL